MKKNIFLILIYLLSTFFTIRLQAAEDSVYSFKWLDQDKEVYVLQNRTFRKDGHLFLSAGGGFTTSNSFVKSYNAQGRVNYFFTEEFGFEFLYSKNSGKENDAAASVRDNGLTGSIPFRRIVESYTAAMLVWSPFYAKINTFNSIVYLDWMFAAGAAKLDESNNRNELADPTDKTETKESHSGVIWQTAMMIYLNSSWSMRVDLTGIHYRAPTIQDQTIDSWYTNYDATISLGFNF
jgi:outer membrane beta-barrel protein